MDLNPSIFISATRVLANGSLVSTLNTPIIFYPLPPPNHLYIVELNFTATDPGAMSPTLRVMSPEKVVIDLPNFGFSGPAGLSSPLYVANYLGKKVLLHLSSQVIGAGESATRLIHYTFMDGGAAQNV